MESVGPNQDTISSLQWDFLAIANQHTFTLEDVEHLIGAVVAVIGRAAASVKDFHADREGMVCNRGIKEEDKAVAIAGLYAKGSIVFNGANHRQHAGWVHGICGDRVSNPLSLEIALGKESQMKPALTARIKA